MFWLDTVVEQVDGKFLQDHFKTDKGLLMKPQRLRGIDYLGSDWEKYKGQHQPQSVASKKQSEYLFTMTTGKIYTGFVVSQRAEEVLIREATGVQRKLQQKEIESKEIQKQSMMPDGLAGNITPQQLADLIAYLQWLE